jgi:PleD family two-component response regulator
MFPLKKWMRKMDDTKKNSVLIVDDESSYILELTHILQSEYTIYAAKDGEAAILAAAKYLPDVILLDIMMPDMDGYAVLAALKTSETTRHIPVIFATGLTDIAAEEKGLVLGVSDYITKPFSPAIIWLRIRNQMKMIRQMEHETAKIAAKRKEVEELLKTKRKDMLDKPCELCDTLLGVIDDILK